MKKIIAYFVIILSSLILIIEIINDFSVLKTGYTVVFCENDFVRDTLIVKEYGSATGTGRNSSSNFLNVYHGFLVSNNKKASITMSNYIDPFSNGFKGKRIIVYHSKFTSFNLFFSKPTSIFELNLKYLLEPFFFLFSIFSIFYLLLRKYSNK